MSNFNFIPCHDFCPAITGKPYGSVQYCPMQQNLRHRKLNLKTKNISPYLNDYPEGEHPFYDHPDYTDCCINFQCCAGKIESLGMKKFFEELTEIGKQYQNRENHACRESSYVAYNNYSTSTTNTGVFQSWQ